MVLSVLLKWWSHSFREPTEFVKNSHLPSRNYGVLLHFCKPFICSQPACHRFYVLYLPRIGGDGLTCPPPKFLHRRRSSIYSAKSRRSSRPASSRLQGHDAIRLLGRWRRGVGVPLQVSRVALAPARPLEKTECVGRACSVMMPASAAASSRVVYVVTQSSYDVGRIRGSNRSEGASVF